MRHVTRSLLPNAASCWNRSHDHPLTRNRKGKAMSENTAGVVIGVDGSKSALDAALWAAAVAEKFDTTLRIVHAMPSIGHNLTDVAAAIRAAVIDEQRDFAQTRSEERRVGKEWRCRWSLN